MSNGHSIDEMLQYQFHGAEIAKILCIFDQSKDVARSKLQEEKLSVSSVATYEDILEVAIEDGLMGKTLLPQYLLWPTGTHWVREANKLTKTVNEMVES
jgi:orotate phosphoribosyltransferase